MLDLENIERLARRLADLYQGVELSALLLLTRHLKRGLGSEAWASQRLAELPEVQKEVRRLVAGLQRKRGAEIIALTVGAHQAGAQLASRTLRRAKIVATLATTSDPAATAALSADLSGRLAGCDRRILRAVPDAYRQVIGRVTAQGLAGEFTRRGAAQAALNSFADRGITGFIDAAGRSHSLASYTEMATRTAVLKAGRQGTIDEVRTAGRDLVVVGGSSSCCPLCAPWEGKVLSLDGATAGYPTLAAAQAAGLHHPNCGHRIDPYVEGLTDTSGIQHGDPERYEARQEQRNMERHVRQHKGREAAAMDDVARKRAVAKTREWQGKLREHVAEHDLKRLRYREQIKTAI